MAIRAFKSAAFSITAFLAVGLSHSALGMVTENTSDEASDAQEQADLSDARCRDIMILSGLDRDVTIAFLHGYLVGKAGDTQVDSEKLTDSTEVFLHTCLDNPDAKALEVLSDSLAE